MTKNIFETTWNKGNSKLLELDISVRKNELGRRLNGNKKDYQSELCWFGERIRLP